MSSLRAAAIVVATVAAAAHACATELRDYWAPLPATPPLARSGSSTVFDSQRDRLVIFGGQAPFGLSDVWQYHLGTRTWSRYPTVGTPIARYRHTAVYDHVHDRMVVFGGFTDFGLSADLIALDFTTREWSSLSTTGSAPSPRARHAVAYDPQRNQMIVFGGFTGLTSSNDVYILDLTTLVWTHPTPPGAAPEPRQTTSLVYRRGYDQLILFGGNGETTTNLDDTWFFNLQTRTWIPATLSPRPVGRYDHAAAYDSTTDRMMLFGGAFNTLSLNDEYQLALSGTMAWSGITPGGSPPPPRGAFMCAPDIINNCWHIYGGQTTSGDYYDDTYVLRMSPLSWEAQPDSGIVPPKRMAAHAINDPTHNRMVVFGGWDGHANSATNDTWELRYGEVGAPALTWAPIVSIPNPPARYGAGHLYDPDSLRMFVLYGGLNNDAFADGIDAFDLRTNTWSPYSTLNVGPAGRTGHATVYDSLRHRIILFGGMRPGVGSEIGNVSMNDTWVLDMATRQWTLVASSPGSVKPPKRLRMAHCEDPVGDRMLISCGADTVAASRDTAYFYNDTWAFDFNTLTWSELPTTNDLSPRFDVLSFVIPDQNRMLVFGGATEQVNMDSNEMFSLDLTTLEWSLLTIPGPPPEPRNGYTMVFDYARRWIIPYSGINPGSGTEGDTPILDNGGIFYQAPARVDFGTAAPPRSYPRVHPSTRGLRADVLHLRGGGADFMLSHPRAGRADVTIHRADGAPVWRTAVTLDGSRGARLRWTARTGDGLPVASGVYFASIEAGGERVQRKIAVVR